MTLKKPIVQPGCSKRKMRKYKMAREIERKRLNMIANEGIKEFKTFPSMAKERESGIFINKKQAVGKSTDSPEIISYNMDIHENISTITIPDGGIEYKEKYYKKGDVIKSESGDIIIKKSGLYNINVK
ncbi:MAG: hypothetical protein ACFFG0_42350 [Candidatus Thorarchaeota archaeon]